MTGRRVMPTATLVLPASAPYEQWIGARRSREEVPGGYCIGSSDVASILDLQGVDTPAHVFHDKVNAIETRQNEPMAWGKVFEEPIAQEWCRRNRTAVRRIGLVSNVDEPWHQTTLDRRVLICPLGLEGPCFLEVKNVGQYTYKTRWHSDLPDRILVQILHQLLVTGCSHAHYVALVGGNDPHQGVVYADREEKLIAYVRNSVNAFRANHLLPRVAPPWTAEDKVDKYLELDAQLHSERVGELAIDDVDLVVEYAKQAQIETAAKKEKARLKLELVKLAGGAQLMTVAGDRAYEFGPGTRTNVDLERLREKYPDAYADPEVVSDTTFYTLRIDNRLRKMAKEE